MKIKHLLLALALPVVAFFGSCGGDSEDPKPSIFVAGLNLDDDYEFQADSLLTFSIAATSGSGNLSGINANYSLNGAATKSFFDSSVTGNAINCIVKTRLEGSVDDVVVFNFTAKDANGQSTTYSIKVTIIPPTAPLQGFQTQLVYNSNNTGFEIAYDLNKAVGLLKNDAATRKDLMDMSTSAMAQFSKIWGSDNKSKFVKVTSNDFTNASITTFLYDLWKANSATATAQTAVLAVGDVYLVKSGQDLPFNLYIIKVTKIQDIATIGNHNDYVEFSYKMIDD
ncbi:MAG: hypothetical protein O2814_01170 [Bacteroidetes bacterium]|nr:hypothetical protein [Bacteroidota bacterium]